LDIIQFRLTFNEKLETLGLKTDAEQEAEMMLNWLSIKDLINKVSESYTGLIQTNNWEPAGRSADTSVVPHKFASSAEHSHLVEQPHSRWRNTSDMLQLWRTGPLIP
jgi:hypothetical protein